LSVAFWPAAAEFWLAFSVPLTALLPVAGGLFSAAAPLDGLELLVEAPLWSLGVADWAVAGVLEEPAFALDAADWLLVSVPLGVAALEFAEDVPWVLLPLLLTADESLGLWFCCCCIAVWSLAFAVGFWVPAAPACDVAPSGVAVAELEGLLALWLPWAEAPVEPVAPAAPGLEPLLLLQVSATCCTELTVSVFPLEAAPLCEPELGAAVPEVPVADELPEVPVICTSCPTCCCSWLVSPLNVYVVPVVSWVNV
jgi:hypothetical protein